MTYLTVTKDGGFVGTTYTYTPVGLRRAMADATTLAKHFPARTYTVMGYEATPEKHVLFPVPERLMRRMKG